MKFLPALLATWSFFLGTWVCRADEPQVWQARDGQTFTGDFLAIRPGKVYVRGKDMKIMAIPMAKLSDACLAEAGYLQEKLEEWAYVQVDSPAMEEATAWAVLMLAPKALDGKSFLVAAHLQEIDPGQPNRPVKGPKVKLKTDTGIECQAEFKDHGELLVKATEVYGDLPAGVPAEGVSSRNATLLLQRRQPVFLQAKAGGGKILGAMTVTREAYDKARAAGPAVPEYEAEIIRQRMAVMEEQIRTGASVAGSTPLPGADGKPLAVPQHRYTEEEITAIKAELSWLHTKRPQKLIPE